jgi:hypothetical protein
MATPKARISPFSISWSSAGLITPWKPPAQANSERVADVFAAGHRIPVQAALPLWQQDMRRRRSQIGRDWNTQHAVAELIALVDRNYQSGPELGIVRKLG